MARNRGFTLLELLVALAVFAIGALTVLKHSTQMVRQQAYLEEKTVSLWLAENELEKLRLDARWPGEGTKEDRLAAAGREWLVATEITATPMETLRKVEIRVRSSGDGEGAGTRLVGYVGEH